MNVPVSGLKQIIDTTIDNESICFSLKAATVQSCLRNSDRLLCKASSKFVLLAAMGDVGRSSQASSFVQGHLYSQIKRVFSLTTRSGSQASFSISPLYTSLLKMAHAYRKMHPKGDLFQEVQICMAYLDISTRVLYVLACGQRAHMPFASNGLGHALQPSHSKRHRVFGANVSEAMYTGLHDDNLVILGSPGVWKYIHPAKAGLHAAAYSSAPHLSTPDTPHDAASAVLRTALRAVVKRCAASSSARLACLHSLPQLDRLYPGSRAEARTSALVIPRRRGDVHPDMTSCVLSFSFPPNPKSSSTNHASTCRMCAFAARHFQRPPPADFTHSLSCTSNTTLCSSAPSSTPPELHSPPPTASFKKALHTLSSRILPLWRPSPASPEHLTCSSHQTITSVGYDTNSTCAGLPPSPTSGSKTWNARRRWLLLQRHVHVLILEAGLRRSMWQSACRTALKARTLHPTPCSPSSSAALSCNSAEIANAPSPKNHQLPSPRALTAPSTHPEALERAPCCAVSAH